MKILLTGVTGLRNRGVEALVVTSIAELHRIFPGAEIFVATWSPEYDASRLPAPGVHFFASPAPPAPARPTPVPLWRSFLRRVKRRFRNSPPAPPRSPWPCGTPDLVIATGGDLFGSDYGLESLRLHLWPLDWAAKTGVPTVMLAQSIGPFRNQAESDAWIAVASRMTLITVRESRSHDYVVGRLGLDPQRVIRTADPAFLLRPSSRVGLAGAEFNHGPVVAVAISEGIARWTGQDVARHLAAWTETIRAIVDHWKARVVILPHVQESYGDDRVVGTRVLRALDFDPRVQLLAADLSAAEYKSIAARCEMVIAERMHAALAGLSSRVCTIAIGYSVKAQGIVEDLLGADATASGLVMPLNDFLDSGTAIAALSKIWTDRAQHARRLEAALPRAVSDARRNFDLTYDLFHGR